MAKLDQTRRLESSSPRPGIVVRKDKFLVEWAKRLGHKQLFFGFWALLVVGIAGLMMAYYRRVTRRNFRGTNDGLPPIFTPRNSRPLPGGKGESVVVNEPKSPTRKSS